MQYRIIIDFIIREEEIILIDIGAHEEVYWNTLEKVALYSHTNSI
jgi:mRNA-degrading endonuclease RelE of RelBE toxin-antitoxin system